MTAHSAAVARLADFVRIPTVSSHPRHAGDVRRGAAWLADRLRRSGLERVALVPMPRHPLVRAEWRHAPGRPTVLIYGHYDVQPAEPLAEWTTPPFEPSIRNGFLYGRGASDDKGQLLCHVEALATLLRETGRLPVNVVCLFEGEEEIGSPGLGPYLERHGRSLGADVAVISDTRMLGPGRPALTHSLRGALACEIEARGPRRDLHSGSFGGAVHNPLQALCEIVAGLHGRDGRIAIPGFYDRVRVLSRAERERMRADGPADAEILRDAGAERGWGEPGYSFYERTTIRPALTVNGLTGGHQGPGGKGIIPARAVAKLGFRLVPDQTPEEVAALLRRHLARTAPPTVRIALRVHHGSRPALIDRRHPALGAAAGAYHEGFGAAPVFLRSGGSIPVVERFQTLLGIPTVLLGFALPDDRMHAPNERFYLPNFFRGIATCRAFLQRTAQAGLAPTGYSRSPSRTPPWFPTSSNGTRRSAGCC